MVNHFLGNPHKTEYEDIDEDFHVLPQDFVDDQDSSDYEDEEDDFYEDEEEVDDDDDEDDGDDEEDLEEEDYWGDIGFLSDSDLIDIDVAGPPDGGCAELIETLDETTILNTGKDAATEMKNLEDISSTVHQNLENNPET